MGLSFVLYNKLLLSTALAEKVGMIKSKTTGKINSLKKLG